MKIILWRLGSLEHKIFPTAQAVKNLENILLNIDTSEEIFNIVWGPDIDVKVIDVENLDDLDQYILAYSKENPESQ